MNHPTYAGIELASGIAVAAALILAAPSSPGATLGWELDFNSGFQSIVPSEEPLTGAAPNGNRLDQAGSGGRKWSLADPADGSNLALRVFQSGDASCLTGAASKPKHRAHFHPTKDTFNYPYELNEHHWIGYRIWFPAELSRSWSWLHGNDAEVAHWSYQGENMIRIRADQDGPAYRIRNGYSTAAQQDIYPPDQQQTISMPTGRWVNVVHHVLRKRDASGIIDVWIDGIKRVNWHGIRTASDPDAIGQSGDGRNLGRWKIGLYWGPIDRPVDFMIYLDDMRHARGADGYALVDPSRERTLAAPPSNAAPAKSSAQARLLYENTFEDGWNSPSPTVFKCVELQNEPGRYVRQTAIVRTGKYAARILNRGGDAVICTIDKNKHRAELATERVVSNEEGVEHWYGFSHYIPSNEGALPTPGRGHIIWQTKHGSGGPEFEMQFKSDRKVTLGLQAGDPFTDYALFGKSGIPVALDAWHDWVIRQKRSWSGKGTLQIWHNGVEITNLPDTKGNTGRPSNRDFMEIHTGSYYGTATSEPDYVIYIDNFRYAAGAGGFSLVDPSRESVLGAAGGPDATRRTEASQ